MPLRTLTALVVWTAVALAQPAQETRMFAFANAQGPRQMAEITHAIRTLGDLREQAALDPVARAIKVTGNPDQLALANWLFTEFDRPPGVTELTIHESTFSDPRFSAVRVYYPAHFSRPTQIQEFINAARSTGDVYRFAALTAIPAIAMRASPEQATYVDWLIREIDRPAAAGGHGVRRFEYNDILSPPAARDKPVRLYYPAVAMSEAELQQAVSVLRAIGDVQRIVGLADSALAIVVRASDDRIALTDWLFQQLDRAAPDTEPREYRLPDELVAVVGIPANGSMDLATRIVDTTGMRRVFYISRTRSLVLRGTPEQVAAAEAILR